MNPHRWETDGGSIWVGHTVFAVWIVPSLVSASIRKLALKWINQMVSRIRSPDSRAMKTVCTGHTDSKIEFQLLASAPLAAEDLRNIGNLMHAGATKVEEEFSAEARITG